MAEVESTQSQMEYCEKLIMERVNQECRLVGFGEHSSKVQESLCWQLSRYIFDDAPQKDLKRGELIARSVAAMKVLAQPNPTSGELHQLSTREEVLSGLYTLASLGLDTTVNKSKADIIIRRLSDNDSYQLIFACNRHFSTYAALSYSNPDKNCGKLMEAADFFANKFEEMSSARKKSKE